MSEPTAISQPISLNLWRDPWISVIQPDCQMCKLSIGACLARTPKEPLIPGARTACTSSEKSIRSGVTNSSGNVDILFLLCSFPG